MFSKSSIPSYPFNKNSKNIWHVSPKIKLVNFFKGHRPAKLPIRNAGIEIWPANQEAIRPLESNDLPVVFLVHNDKKMLPSFLKHYRSLGVTRFICMDDQSDDGTFEFLSSQDDVDIFNSNVRYVDAHRGKAWREMLVTLYGKNRWYINIDSDEYLFAGNDKNTNLLDYAKKLEAKGIKRLPAPMIDLIPSQSLSQASFSGDDETMPWEVATHFDMVGYEVEINEIGISLNGGARVRLYDAVVELMKYPLIYWDDATSMGRTVHFPKPSHYNFAQACGCLLHFKIFSDVKEVARDGAEDGQYFLGGQEYAKMHDFFEGHDGSVLTCESSVKFENQDQLIDLGFVVPI